MSWNPDEIQKHVTSVLGNCFCCAANLDSSSTAGTNSHGCHCSVITSCTSNLWVDWTHLTRGLQVLLQYKHRGEQGTISFGCYCLQKEAIEFYSTIPLPVSFARLMSPRRLIFMSIFSWCLAVGEARWANCCWTTAEADPCSYCKLSHCSRFTVAWLLICWWGSQWPFDAPFSVPFSCIEKLCLVSLKQVWWASEWVPHTDL